MEKGFSSMPIHFGPSPVESRQKTIYQEGDTNRPKEVQYMAAFQRDADIMEEPDEKIFSIYSQLVYQNTPYNKSKN